MVQVGALLGPLIRPLVSPKVELIEDAGLSYRTISAHRSASNRGKESHYGRSINFDGG